MSKRKNTAAKKSGPITLEGRAKSALNAIKHGLYSAKVVLSHESKAEFAALHAELMLEFDPTTPAQAHQVDQIAAAQWRLQRIWSNETVILELAMDRHHKRVEAGDDPGDVKLRHLEATAFEDAEASKTRDRMINHEVRLTNIIGRATRTLERLKKYNPAREGWVKSAPIPPKQHPQPIPIQTLTTKSRNEPVLDENHLVQTLVDRVKELLDTENRDSQEPIQGR